MHHRPGQIAGLGAPFVPTGVASLQLSPREALHGCNESILRAHHCSWQRRDKRASSGAERPIRNYYDMAAAVESATSSRDSLAAAMTGDGSSAETERQWEAFAPHLPHAFADGDRVFVMKSRGGQRGSRPFAAAVVRGEATEDGRRTVVYKDGSTYAARPELLVPIRGGGPLTLFTATTRAYRLAASTQDVGASVLEIGCDQGETTRRLVARGCAVLAVDKAADRLRAAQDAVPGATFLVCDVLCEPDRVEGEYSSVFVDINGSRAYDTVLKCVRWAERRWPAALVVVKSSEAMQRHFPGAIEASAPARQRA